MRRKGKRESFVMDHLGGNRFGQNSPLVLKDYEKWLKRTF